ncbi:hypothetical protein O2W15_05350 [Modestobacter sp. VKM Ac-2979]|uniref:hypothetical protein n=1 Tax=unclassified Modestobacter TaxID=2643866 RepID=UPI0022AB73A2|nr:MULTISPECIES: hypothetical protein [unclassified Modestobacter]MCZ2810855.1 hypothetical protein [Modestobacter sp. VKM Ac-2979]MCZ2840368.1 hypothetical protein [Modestobacter sp. VKM Ac-2980]
MSQPHPPIPEPQPQPAQSGATRHPADDPAGDQHAPTQHPVTEHPATEPAVTGTTDDPRTQSILLPPSQRETVEPDAGAHGSHQPYQPSYDPPTAVHGTGPVDVGSGSTPTPSPTPPPVPGPATTPGTAPGTPSAGAQDGGSSSSSVRSRLAAVRSSGRPGTELVALLLGVLGLALLELGLNLDFVNQSLWDVVPTWSAFATVAALVALVPSAVALAGRRGSARTAWRVGAGGLVALAAFWVLIALPLVASDRGFWLTAALAATGAAVVLAPGRPE